MKDFDINPMDVVELALDRLFLQRKKEKWWVFSEKRCDLRWQIEQAILNRPQDVSMLDAAFEHIDDIIERNRFAGGPI